MSIAYRSMARVAANAMAAELDLALRCLHAGAIRDTAHWFKMASISAKDALDFLDTANANP